AFDQMMKLRKLLPPPPWTNLSEVTVPSAYSGAILAAPLGIWLIRRFLGWAMRGHRIWGVERPALEIWTAILAFAPVAGWLGTPAWWREPIPRLPHNSILNTARRGSLPALQVLYFGRFYKCGPPCPNAWVLIAITVPAAILFAAGVGLLTS